MATNNTMNKNYVMFVSKENNLGWYYTKYNPNTKEGEGWFGTESKPEYMFEDLLMYDEVYGEDVLKSRTCGIGEGCFWTDFQ